MSKILAFTLSMFVMPAVFPTSEAAESHNPAKSGPLAYAIALKDTFNQFGVLDIATGTFHPIAELPNPAQGIARDAEGGIYIVEQ
jgi:hypothetical protein